MQFKAKIKSMALHLGVTPQLVLQNFMLERLLERIAKSKYKYNFIFKGGFVISSIVGLSTRTTMDLDTTIKNLELNTDNLLNIIKEIVNINLEDNVNFEIVSISNIREHFEYPGIRISFKALLKTISVPIILDVTTGDIITPNEINYTHVSIFDQNKINVLTYNVETILAEKLETILTRSIANTRLRDYYDIYILVKFNNEYINFFTLKSALQNTVKKRNSEYILKDYVDILNLILNDNKINTLWIRYANTYSYASNIIFKDIIDLIIKILNDQNCTY